MLIEQASTGKLENQPGSNIDETLESMISGTLSRVRDKVGEICMTELSRNNAPLIMATCGSKGALLLQANGRRKLTSFCRQAPRSTSPRWSLVSGSRSSQDIVSPTVSRTVRSPTSSRAPRTRPRRDSSATVSTRDSSRPSSSSTPFRVEKDWSIPLSRRPRLGTWLVVS